MKVEQKFTCIVLTNFKNGGKRYKMGEIVEMNMDQVELLLPQDLIKVTVTTSEEEIRSEAAQIVEEEHKKDKEMLEPKVELEDPVEDSTPIEDIAPSETDLKTFFQAFNQLKNDEAKVAVTNLSDKELENIVEFGDDYNAKKGAMDYALDELNKRLDEE